MSDSELAGSTVLATDAPDLSETERYEWRYPFWFRLRRQADGQTACLTGMQGEECNEGIAAAS